jgi:hypothetical protein
MAPLQADEPNRWTRQIQDVIADTSAVREGLHDDEATPLIDWGAVQAEHIGARLVEPDTPEPDEEQVGEIGYTLVRLMTRITWLVTYRHKKDAAWLTKTFQMVNKLNADLHGPDAPTLSDDAIAAWIADHPNHTNGELVQDLIARLTPAAPVATEPESPPEIPVQNDTPDIPDFSAGEPS